MMLSFPTIETEEQRRKVLTQLQQLRKSAGWKYVVAHLSTLKAQMESDIFKVGGNELKYSDKDLYILGRENIDELIRFPDAFADFLASVKADPEELDPYAE